MEPFEDVWDRIICRVALWVTTGHKSFKNLVMVLVRDWSYALSFTLYFV